MAPRKKEHSIDLRTLVIKHYLNVDSQREIAKKVMLSRETVRSMINKYKNTKCIGNLFGRDRKRKTTATTDRLIQRKLNLEYSSVSQLFGVERTKLVYLTVLLERILT